MGIEGGKKPGGGDPDSSAQSIEPSSFSCGLMGDLSGQLVTARTDQMLGQSHPPAPLAHLKTMGFAQNPILTVAETPSCVKPRGAERGDGKTGKRAF